MANARYLVEHKGIPAILFSENGNRFLVDLIGRREDVILTLYRVAGQEDCRKEDFSVDIRSEDSEGIFVIIDMPEPRLPTECRRVFVCNARGGSRRAYYTVEMSFGCDMLCAWDAEGRHLNYGPAPESPEEQYSRVRELFAEKEEEE